MATETSDEAKRKEPSFWDSIWATILLIAAILAARQFIMEPFKIPSGSMEPTLIGDEDYGDRIVTNKLAYVDSKQVVYVVVGAALVIAIGFVASKAWKRLRSMITSALLLAGVVGGICFAWSKDAVAGVPKRFEVVVFQYETEWESPGSTNKKINYIKRLCGLPGETIVISGGDLFLRNKNGEDTIIRKWQEAPAVQDQFWYPVNLAWLPTIHHDISKEDRANLAFPWTGAEEGKSGVKLNEKSLDLDGSAPVELTYKYPVTNVHIKQGRRLFKHVGCPAAHKEGVMDPSTGIRWRDQNNMPSEYVYCYADAPWEGVQCPLCKQVFFPMALGTTGLQPWQPNSLVEQAEANRKAAENERLHKGEAVVETPGMNGVAPVLEPRFFYGGDDIVGDLKLDMELDVQTPGTIQMQVGSNLHSARWTIGGNAEGSSDKIHDVKAAAPALSSGKHTLTLEYVDGTVIAILDGKAVEQQPIDVQPISHDVKAMQSLARVSFNGTKATMTHLNLYRDQYYMPMLKGSKANDRARKFGEEYDSSKELTVYPVQHDHYLMMGDNAPSSADSRIWGLVPQENIVGRASFIWWPPSRWRIITHGDGESSKTDSSNK